ncbi:antitoxin [Micromonospora sp. CPCC 206060]|uniref:antitoxin n=1 Tax=Micromonospora sp. CPCC 206060 TaxID=3122406 RepID=UPI002FF2CB32
MSDFMNKAKEFADQHEKQVDQGLEKGGEAADRRTGGRYDEQIDKGVDMAQRRTGEGDQSPR